MKKLFPVLFLVLSIPVIAQDARTFFEKGDSAYKVKDYLEAYDMFGKAVEIEPGGAKYQYNLGLAARKLNLYAESAQALNKAKQLDPSIGFTKNRQDFEDKLKEMIRLSDGAANTGGAADIFAEGETAYKNGEYLKAFSLFTNAVKANPGVAKYQYNLGLAARKITNYTTAADAFEEAKRLDPSIGFTNDKQGFEEKLAEVTAKADAGTGGAADTTASDTTPEEGGASADTPSARPSKFKMFGDSNRLRNFLLFGGVAIFVAILRLRRKKRKDGGGTGGTGGTGRYGGRYTGGASSSDRSYHDYDRYSSSGSHSSDSGNFDRS